jgi:hypothetical protein
MMAGHGSAPPPDRANHPGRKVGRIREAIGRLSDRGADLMWGKIPEDPAEARRYAQEWKQSPLGVHSGISGFRKGR